MLTLHFAEVENKKRYKSSILSELRKDFNKNNQLEKHFWHNRKMISDAFDDHHALVVCNEEDKFIGWMIWSLYEGGAEIDIVDVKEDYRRKGIFSMMLSAFTEKFPHLLVLTAQVLLESRPVFERLGWQTITTRYGVSFFKPLCVYLSPLKDLPDDLTIAVCSEDFYQVQRAPNDYVTSTSYFNINLDVAGNLIKPIVFPCNPEGYIGIYSDKILVKKAKPKHLEGTVSDHSGLLIISKISPEILAMCDKKLLLSKRSREEGADSSSAPSSKKLSSVLSIEENVLPECFSASEELLTLQNSSCLWQPRQLQLSGAANEEESKDEMVDGSKINT